MAKRQKKTERKLRLRLDAAAVTAAEVTVLRPWGWAG